MRKEPHTLRHPSRICILVGVGVAAIGSFLMAILLGTGYGFGLVLHLILAGLVGWLLAIRCTENGDELFGIVGFFYTPQVRERVAEAAGRMTDSAKARAERVTEAARRLPEQVAGTGAGQGRGQDLASARETDASGGAAAAAAPSPAETPNPGTDSQTRPVPGRRPPLLDAPRDDPDDLTGINGIGPKVAAMLNDLGIWHFAQIATWTDEELAWVDGQLGAFRGRARRDDWVGQARALIAERDEPAAHAHARDPEADAENGPADRG